MSSPYGPPPGADRPPWEQPRAGQPPWGQAGWGASAPPGGYGQVPAGAGQQPPGVAEPGHYGFGQPQYSGPQYSGPQYSGPQYSGPGYPPPQPRVGPYQPPAPPYGYAPQPAFVPGPPAPDAVPVGNERTSALPWMVLSGIVLLVGVGSVLVGGFIIPGWFRQDVFDASAVQDGVEQILSGPYNITGVRGVTCPPGENVQPGTMFDCRVNIDGQWKAVTVKVKDAHGTYEVGRPR